MSKEDLKKTLKPLIKQCIREVVFEEGFLSGIIAEVVKGTSDTQVIAETKTKPEPRPVAIPKRANSSQAREVMKSAFGGEFYEQIFEGMEPISSPGQPGETPHGRSPLSGIAPGDKGVDVGRIFGNMQDTWKKLI